MASGIDPKKSTIFVQSTVPYHSELSWILNCVTRIGWLNRMTQFKEKAGKIEKCIFRSLYISKLNGSRYFIYFSDLVPVGDDQKQHLELTRDIAQKFNNDYSDFGGKDFFLFQIP